MDGSRFAQREKAARESSEQQAADEKRPAVASVALEGALGIENPHSE